MKKITLASAALSALAIAASSASAALSLTATPGVLNVSNNFVDINIINDGVGTGTKIVAYQLSYSGTAVSFDFGDLDADPSTPNAVDVTYGVSAGLTGGFSGFRLGSASNTSLVSSSPVDTSNLWASPIGNFQVTITTLAVTQPSSGVRIARFIFANTVSPEFTLSGVAAGEIGPTNNPVSVSFPTVPIPEPVTLGVIAGAATLLLRRRKA